MFQSEQYSVIGSGAGLGRADPFAFKIFGFLYRRPTDENVVHLVDHAGNHRQIGAPRSRADHRLTGHADDRDIAGNKRLRATGSTFDQDQVGIGAVALEQAFVFGHPQRNLIRAERGVAHQETLLTLNIFQR